MLHIVVLSDSSTDGADVTQSLGLLAHRFSVLPLGSSLAPIQGLGPDVVMVDAREELVAARNCAHLLKGAGLNVPLLMVLTEGGMAAVAAHWMVDDIVLASVGPAELEARLRLLSAYRDHLAQAQDSIIRVGGVTVDEASYSARLQGSPLNLTYKEFELLKFLVQHPGRVFTRSQLLSEVWGYDYYGGTRTVDVHIRRLRSKLGPDHEQLITTVRNVGYSFNSPRGESR
ncbi:winged helix-turn-helix transcriptional regulator [Rothia sp. CCM 9417]|uniref:winged helix-turn-helix transcriptional regulator n=1 Tax=unclassified Rothia (in: high G+C Gram-positive bacteria) TaxID=2689056 RepID=UPI003AD01500